MRRARRRRFRFWRRGRALEQIGKIKFLLRLPHDVNLRLVDDDFADHRCKSEQRRPRDLQRQMPEVDERFLRVVALADVELVEVELQPIKIEADFADADVAMNAGGDGAGQHVPQYERNRDVSREAKEQHDRDDDHADFAHASRTAKLLRARDPPLRRMKRRPQAVKRAIEKTGHEPGSPDAASVSRRRRIVN